MTTVFPGAIDALPRPASNTKRNAAAGLNLSTVIDNLSDAIEAIETVIGAGITTPNGVMRKLGEAVGTGASGVMEVTSIPQTYRHLLVTAVMRSSVAATSDGVRLTFESSPTAGAYDRQRIQVFNTTVSGSEDIGASDFILMTAAAGASSPSGLVSAMDFIVFNYASTTVAKIVRNSGVAALDYATGNIRLENHGGVFEVLTPGIDRVRLTLASGNWTTLARMSVYGLPN